MRTLYKFFAHNWIAIFYFNFKMLPLKQAIKLPFDFYYKVRFESLEGKVQISNAHIYRGMIKIGGRGSEMFSRSESIIDLKGQVTFGSGVELGHGTLLRVEKTGTVIFGNNVRLGAMSKLFCLNRIEFGTEIDFSWECQIFDSNFHFIEDTITKNIEPRDGTISIGDKNWFGNRITVMKGTKTPSNFIVASNSLCNTSYLDAPNCSIFGGTPAKLLRNNKRRIFEAIEKTPY